jgi:hypothetical protein
MTWTRQARCSDCKFLKEVRIGNMKRHRCDNEKSKFYNTQVTLKDLVCVDWKLS